jgi:predicted AAA+ superfamily ATPase
MNSAFLFPEVSLGPELVQDVRRMNPWWEGKPLPPLPATRRHLVRGIHQRLAMRLAPAVVVRGPRQIGKTTAQLQVLSDLMDRGVPANNIFRIQCDELPELSRLSEPILRLVDWYERNVLECTLNEAARAGQPTYLFLDEVQNLKDWAPQLKSLVDASATQVVVTGSSALRIEQGRDSLAGRITTLEAGVLTLTEIAAFHGINAGDPFLLDNGLEPIIDPGFWRDLVAAGRTRQADVKQAFAWFSQRGGYPLVHQREDVPWGLLADQLNETVIRRVIQHDLRIGERGRKRDAPLLEEVFRMACRYVGQSPAPVMLAREAQRARSANVGPQRITQYLRFLGDTLLLRLIEPLEIRLKRRRGNLKICLADLGLRASWLQEVIPLDPAELQKEPHLADLAGHLAESVIGVTAATIASLDIAHLPERSGQPEIDFVLTVGTRRIPIEVKYRRRVDSHRDTEAVRTFLEKTVNNASFGLIITQDELELSDPRLIAVPLSTFMLLR